MKKKFFRRILAFILIFSWLFFGWPPIWPLGKLGVNTIRIPPEIQKAQAATPPVIEAGDITDSGNDATSALWALNTPAYDIGDLLIFNLVSDANVTHDWPSSGGPAGLMPSLVTNSGCNSSCGTSWAVSRPAYSSGDLVVVNVASDLNVTHDWSATGPNGETIVTIVDSHGSAATSAERVSAFYYIATNVQSASTFTVTSSGADEWTATAFIVPSGDFNASTPIDSSGTGGNSSGTATTVPTAAWSATSGAANGLVVAWMGVDQDPMTVVPSGWVSVTTVDRGNVAGTLAVRTTRAGASESIASVDFNISGDSSSTLGYVINTSGSESSSSATIVDLVDSHGAGTAQRVSAFYFVATESRRGGYVLVTPSGVEQWTGVVVRVPAGEFDPTAPIQATVGTGGSSSNSTSVPSPSWNSSTADGRVVVWLGVDQDPMTGTPAGWTNRSSIDRGNVAGTLSTRDAANTLNETIASANWTIASDTSSTLGYVVNAPPEANNPLSLTVSTPPAEGATVVAGQSYNITYDLSDEEDTVTVDFYYDLTDSGLDGTAIIGCQDQAEGVGATCPWDTSGVTANNYYIYGIVTDGVNPEVNDYSPGVIMIQAAVYSVSVTPEGTIEYGLVGKGESKSTLQLEPPQTRTATNDGNVTAKFNIQTSIATNGISWGVGATAGENIFVHEFSTNGGSSWTPLAAADSYQDLATGIGVGGTQPFDLRLTVPTETGDYQEKTIYVTILAVQQE